MNINKYQTDFSGNIVPDIENEIFYGKWVNLEHNDGLFYFDDNVINYVGM